MAKNTLETLVSKSLKYYEEQNCGWADRFHDSKHQGRKKRFDFIVEGRKYSHAIECKDTTAKGLKFETRRIIDTGQFNALVNFARAAKRCRSWVLFRFTNKKIGKQRIDKSFLINIVQLAVLIDNLSRKYITIEDLEKMIEYSLHTIQPLKLEKLRVEGYRERVLDLRCLL